MPNCIRFTLRVYVYIIYNILVFIYFYNYTIICKRMLIYADIHVLFIKNVIYTKNICIYAVLQYKTTLKVPILANKY